MFGRETRMLLRHYLEQGTTKSALARQLGISRDTVHRWIRDGDLERDVDVAAVRYGPRPPVPTKLDAYKPIIEARLAAYPELSAVRLLEEIRAAGYEGGYTQLKALVRRVRPAPTPEPVIRFETPAGRRAQVDFARFRFAWGVRYALLVVLGYSRLLWCRFRFTLQRVSMPHKNATGAPTSPDACAAGRTSPLLVNEFRTLPAAQTESDRVTAVARTRLGTLATLSLPAIYFVLLVRQGTHLLQLRMNAATPMTSHPTTGTTLASAAPACTRRRASRTPRCDYVPAFRLSEKSFLSC